MSHAGPLNQGEDFGFLSDVDTSRGHRGEEERLLTLAVTWRLKGCHASRDPREESAAVVQAGDDGGSDQSEKKSQMPHIHGGWSC